MWSSSEERSRRILRCMNDFLLLLFSAQNYSYWTEQLNFYSTIHARLYDVIHTWNSKLILSDMAENAKPMNRWMESHTPNACSTQCLLLWSAFIAFNSRAWSDIIYDFLVTNRISCVQAKWNWLHRTLDASACSEEKERSLFVALYDFYFLWKIIIIICHINSLFF